MKGFPYARASGGTGSGATRRAGRVASGCWMILLVALLGVAAAGALVVKRTSTLEAKERFVVETWQELQGQYGRRVDLLQRMLQTPEGKGLGDGPVVKNARRILAFVKKNDLPADPRPSSQDELQAFLDAQQRLSLIVPRVLGVLDGAAGGKPSPKLRDLKVELEFVQMRIALAHRDFYDAVFSFNVAIRAFPEVFLAKVVGLKRSPQPLERTLTADEEEAAEDAEAPGEG